MAEIIEDRVSFEVAKLLDEKGFDEWCTAFYVKQGKNVILQECDKSVCFEKCCNTTLKEYNSKNEYNVSAPTIQMAMKWLMVKHKIYFSILPVFNEGTYKCHKVSVYKAGGSELELLDCGFTKANVLSDCIDATLKECLESLV